MNTGTEHNFHQGLSEAFAIGLRDKFGDPAGPLLGEVVSYYPRLRLDPERLARNVAADGTAALQAILVNRSDDSVLRLITARMIGGALQSDQAAVVRWATEGMHRAERAGGAWADTAPQWRWVLGDPDGFMRGARQIKCFMNQI